ncbi:hypothetical protein niasHT_004934 [Heterodera trifolii]|uniref:Integrase catalytic domain-containing protein n=1 Tax=Heterodera trifolii TaxID=157864 RepID=A0ABD2M8J1_9BILA
MRMFLVPEDMFNSMMKPSTIASEDGSAIGLVRQRLRQIEQNRTMDENERSSRYQQEFKRLNKMVREQEDRPLDVRLQNLNEIISAIPPSVPPPPPSPPPARLKSPTQPLKAENKENKQKTKKLGAEEEDDVSDETEWEEALEENTARDAQQQQQPSSSSTPYGLRSGATAVDEPQQKQKGSQKTTKQKKKQQSILDYIKNNAVGLDVNSPVSYTSTLPLLNEARKRNSTIKRRDVEEYLAGQPSYTLHRQAIRRFTRLPTLASGLHTEWQADLSVLDRLAPQNRGFRYLLVCVDTLSRQLFVEPVKNKKSEEMIRAFERLFARSKYIPWKLVTDQGLEFTAKRVQAYFEAKNIKHFFMYTSPQFHAGMAERANRTIKERLFRYFTARHTQRWVDAIQDIVNGINHSYHSSIQMRPVDVTFENASALRKELSDKAHLLRPKRPPRFKAGDRVRIEKHKHVFQKEYVGRFTGEIFTIDTVDEGRSPITYRIRDMDGELIKGNRTNSFRVRLPRKLQFNAEWDVALATIIYPHSWPSLGTTEEQFIELEWQTENIVRIPVPPSNIIRPYELSKSLYSLLDISSEHLSNQVHDAQQSYKKAMNAARKLAQKEYVKMKSDDKKRRPKRKILDQNEALPLLSALLIAIDTIDDALISNEDGTINTEIVAGALLDREKRAATSNVPLRAESDSEEEYQRKLDNYFLKMRDSDDLLLFQNLIAKHLEIELNKLTKDEQSLNNSIKDLGMEAWIQAYKKVSSVVQFIFDVRHNRFTLSINTKFIKRVKLSEQLAYILGFAPQTQFKKDKNPAKFMPDMSGGVSTLHVYIPDLIEPMMIGNVIAPILRITIIRGNPDEVEWSAFPLNNSASSLELSTLNQWGEELEVIIFFVANHTNVAMGLVRCFAV